MRRWPRAAFHGCFWNHLSEGFGMTNPALKVFSVVQFSLQLCIWGQCCLSQFKLSLKTFLAALSCPLLLSQNSCLVNTQSTASGQLFLKKKYQGKKYSCQHSRDTVQGQTGFPLQMEPGSLAHDLRSTLSPLALHVPFLCYQYLCRSAYSV